MNARATATLVDRLGSIKAEIASLQSEFNDIKATLAESGETEFAGRVYDCTITPTVSNRVDWKGLAGEFDIPQRDINRHTKRVESVVCKVVAKKID